MTEQRVVRTRITHPRTDAARRADVRPVSREIDEQTPIGAVYMSSLIRSQRRLAVTVCATTAAMLVAIVIAGAVDRRFDHQRFLGVPLPWLVLGGFVYPALIGLGAFLVRQSERNERTFADLVQRERPS